MKRINEERAGIQSVIVKCVCCAVDTCERYPTGLPIQEIEGNSIIYRFEKNAFRVRLVFLKIGGKPASRLTIGGFQLKARAAAGTNRYAGWRR